MQRVAVAFGWRAGDDGDRVKAVFDCDFIADEQAKHRWLVRLRELRSLTATSGEVPGALAESIRQLSGRFAYVPVETGEGLTLPMKIETLDGRIRYFYADDPRSPAASH